MDGDQHHLRNMTQLLPACRIDWFTGADEQSLHAARAIAADWRMGRTRVDIKAGGITAALEKYRQSASPPLVIIEIDDHDHALDRALDQLADHCAAGTRAIVIGSINDVTLYRRLVGRGVNDYLLAPVSADDLLDALGRAMAQEGSMGQGKIIGITAAKGGSGATTMAHVLGLMLAQQGQDTLLVDVSGGLGTSGIAFGAEPRRSFEEIVAAGQQGEALNDILRRVCVPLVDNLRLLPGGRGQGPDYIDGIQYQEWIHHLRHQSGVVVLDLPGAHHPLTRHLVSDLDHLVLVTTPMLSALRLARIGIDQIQARRGTEAPLHVIINMIGCFQGCDLPMTALKQAFDKETSLHMPFLPGLCAAADTEGKGYPAGKLRDRAFAALQPLAEMVIGSTAVPARVLDQGAAGWLGRFVPGVKPFLSLKGA